MSARPAGRPERTVLQWIGIVVAVIVALCGLAVIAGFIIIAVSLNSWGSNK